MKIAIVSGASSGIGKSIVKHLDLLSLDEIWLIARNEARLNQLKAELNTTTRCFVLDLSQNSSFEVIKNEFVQANCKVEYLVLSAGVGYNGAFDSLSFDEIQNTININCSALVMLTTIVSPFIIEMGNVICIASGAGFLPQPYFNVYAASKAFAISFSRALREELRQKKVRVTAVCPGPVDTEFFSGLKDVKEYKKKYLISADRVSKGAIKAVHKNKAIYSPTLSIKLVHLVSKIIPTSLLLKFYK